MSLPLITDQAYAQLSPAQPLAPAIYEACTFAHCDFSGADLSEYQFIGCTFVHCNLANATLYRTGFVRCTFEHSKLVGLQFQHMDKLSHELIFRSCNLTYASFEGCKLPRTRFADCTLHNADFGRADFSQSVFADSDLRDAHFEDTLLEKADFRTAHSYSINPATNRLRKARFALPAAASFFHFMGIEVE